MSKCVNTNEQQHVGDASTKGKVPSLPTDNSEEELSSSCSKIGAGVNDTASKASNGMYESSNDLDNLMDTSNEVNEHSKGSDELQEVSNNEAEMSEDSDKQTKVSNRTPESSTSSEELSEHGNEADEPGEGSECASVVDEPPSSKISTTKTVKQTEEVEMACIKEYFHYTIERELDDGEKPSNEHDGDELEDGYEPPHHKNYEDKLEDGHEPPHYKNYSSDSGDEPYPNGIYED